MFDYNVTAADATALLAEFGSTYTLKRFNRGTFDPVTSAVTAVTYTAQEIAAVVLPFKGAKKTALSDALTEALRKGKLRTVYIGATGLDFAPDLLDVISVGPDTFIIQSLDILSPAGTPVLYTAIVEKSNLSAPDLAATLAP